MITDVMSLRGIVLNAVRSNDFKTLLDPEDVEQQLWEKLLTVMPTLKKIKGSGAFGYAKTIVNNEIISMVRSELQKIKIEALWSEHDIKYLVERGINGFDKYAVNPETGFHVLSGRQLLNLIVDWAYKKDEETYKFIMQCLGPSKEVSLEWDEMQKNCSRLTGYSTIPPFSLAKILKIKPQKLHIFKISVNLRWQTA